MCVCVCLLVFTGMVCRCEVGVYDVDVSGCLCGSINICGMYVHL